MTTIAEIDQLPTDARCFRLRRYYLVVGVVGAVFFAAIGVVSTVAALWNLAALIFAIFWSGLTLLAVWLIAAYFRERLYFGEAAIVQHGIFRSRTLQLEEVLQIKWRTWPVGGSVVIRTHSEKATIHLDNFTRDDREELMRFLRESFADEIQENWSRFEDVLGRSSLPEKKRQATRVRYLLMIFFGAHAVVFGIMGAIGAGLQYFVFSGMNATMVIYMLWSHRRKRSTDGEPSVERERAITRDLKS